MTDSSSDRNRESLLNTSAIDWLSVQSLLKEFSEHADPALCFMDFIYRESIIRVKGDDLLELHVTLSEDDWDQCHAFAQEAKIVGSSVHMPHWLKEPIDGVLSSSTCLVAAPIDDENGLTLGFFYAFFPLGKPSDIVLYCQQSLANRCSLLLNQFQLHQRQKQENNQLWKSLEASCLGFMLIDRHNGLVDFGPIYRKAIPDLAHGAKFHDFFAWDNLKAVSEIWSSAFHRSKLLFFHSLHFNQKYKCTVQPLNDTRLLLLAAPVINSNHALVDYGLTSTDFSPQDYITDFVFLQTTTLRTLEDTLAQNESIRFRMSELESSAQDLQRLKLLLEKKIEERNDRVKRLSNFPEQNPNPVFEIDFKKQFLCFSNRAAKEAFGDLLTLPYHEFLGMLDLNHELVANSLQLRAEFTAQDKSFQADAFRIPNESIMRFYSHDISELHLAKVLLGRQQEGINQLLAILDALNIDRHEVARSTRVSQLMEEVSRMLEGMNPREN
jgi:hypothetical protein